MKTVNLNRVLPLMVLLVVFVFVSCVNMEESGQIVGIKRLSEIGQMGDLSEKENDFNIIDEGFGVMTVAIRAKILESTMKNAQRYSLLKDNIQIDLSLTTVDDEYFYMASLENPKGAYTIEWLKDAEVKANLEARERMISRAGESIEWILLRNPSESYFMALAPVDYGSARLFGLLDGWIVMYIKTNSDSYYSIADFLRERRAANGDIEKALQALMVETPVVINEEVQHFTTENGQLVLVDDGHIYLRNLRGGSLNDPNNQYEVYDGTAFGNWQVYIKPSRIPRLTGESWELVVGDDGYTFEAKAGDYYATIPSNEHDYNDIINNGEIVEKEGLFLRDLREGSFSDPNNQYNVVDILTRWVVYIDTTRIGELTGNAWALVIDGESISFELLTGSILQAEVPLSFSRDDIINRGEIVERDGGIDPVEFNITSVVTLEDRYVEVTFGTLTDSIANQTIEVIDPSGNIHSVTPINLSMGATSARFYFTKAVNSDEVGTWRIENLAYVVEDGEEAIVFEDSNLEQAVREAGGYTGAANGPIYPQDVVGIISLYLSNDSNNQTTNTPTSSLEGIQYLVNLQNLGFSNNQVTDLSPLRNLTNLRYLSFGENQISNLSPIRNLNNLFWLSFYGNQVTDLSPLRNLEGLSALYFWDNQVTDLSPLQNLTNLTDLRFEMNEVSDISVLQYLPNLAYIRFWENNVNDIGVLTENIGLGTGDEVDCRLNYLDLTTGSKDMQDIQTLINRGVDVTYDPQNTSQATDTEYEGEIILKSPADRTKFNHYPRQTTLDWEDCEGVIGYFVLVEYGYVYDEEYYEFGNWEIGNYGIASVEFVEESEFSFNFVGAQPGRWCIKPIATQEELDEINHNIQLWFTNNTNEILTGNVSEWRHFRYYR